MLTASSIVGIARRFRQQQQTGAHKLHSTCCALWWHLRCENVDRCSRVSDDQSSLLRNAATALLTITACSTRCRRRWHCRPNIRAQHVYQQCVASASSNVTCAAAKRGGAALPPALLCTAWAAAGSLLALVAWSRCLASLLG
eukprot:365767-Chlamydomonas_euryale.AAC.4